MLLIYGKSGSGKSTVSDIIESKSKYRRVRSYTTRPIRNNESESSYHFIQKEDLDNYERLAEVDIKGNIYFMTKEEIEKCDFAIVEPSGIDWFNEHIGKDNVKSIYLAVSKDGQVSRGISEDRVARDKELFKDIERYDICTNVIIPTDKYTAEEVADFIIDFLGNG